MTRDDLIKDLYKLTGIELKYIYMIRSNIVHFTVGKSHGLSYEVSKKKMTLYHMYGTYVITTILDCLNDDELTFTNMNEGTELVTHEHFLSKLKEIMDAEQNNT